MKEELKKLLEEGAEVEIVRAPSDATDQKIWDCFNRWVSVVSAADMAFRKGGRLADQKEFVDNMLLDFSLSARNRLEEELQSREQGLGLRPEVAEKIRTENQQALVRVVTEQMNMIKDALHRMHGITEEDG